MSVPVLYGLLFFFGMLWGGTIPLIKTSVSTGYHPFGLVFWQLVIASVLLSVVAYFRKSKLIFDGQHLRLFIVVALLGTILPNAFGYWAAYYLPGGVMALTIATVPVFAFIIALIIGTEKLNLKRVMGLALGICAIGLLVLPADGLPDPSKAVFVFIALIAPFCYGLEGNYLAAAQPDGTGPIATILGASLLGTVISFGLAHMVGGFIDFSRGFGVAEQALVGSSILHVIAYVGYVYLVSKAGAVFTSQVAYIVTPAGVMWSILFLGEMQSLWLWLSLGMILIALTMVQPRQKSQS